MPRAQGLTLIETLIAISMLSMIAAMSLPAFSRLIEDMRLRSAVNNCIRSLQLARTEAILRKTYISIANEGGSWQGGWTVFLDSNANGVWESDEQKLHQQGQLPLTIQIVPTTTARYHVTYAPSGESRQPNGGFQADSLYFCPANKSLQGYKIVINKAGRVRSEPIPANFENCQT